MMRHIVDSEWMGDGDKLRISLNELLLILKSFSVTP
jgi:hypothetical protein